MSLPFDSSAIEALLRPYFGAQGGLDAFKPLFGGAVNATIQIHWDQTPYVLRFYLRHPELIDFEEALFHLIKGKISFPPMLFRSVFQKTPFALFPFIRRTRENPVLRIKETITRLS